MSYIGMDIDRASIEWRRRHVAPLHPRFQFLHADCYNPSYNPQGAAAATDYRFPGDARSLDPILLTSVLTHLVADELTLSGSLRLRCSVTG